MEKILLIMCFLPLIASAQREAFPGSDEAIRVIYDRTSSLPDGIAFLTTTKTLLAMDEADHDSAIEVIQRSMGLDRSDAEQVIEILADVNESLKGAHDEATRELACAPDTPRASGAEVYPLFEAIDDRKELLGAEHLAIAKSRLGEGLAARLQAWLESEKFSITHVKVRHEQAYLETGANPDEHLHAICNRLKLEDGKGT